MTVRTQTCSQAHAQTRLAAAEKFLEVARFVEEETDPAFAGVTASLAVLAGIAASDPACCKVLGYRARGESHYDAVQVFAEIEGAGKAAEALRRLISLKDAPSTGCTSSAKRTRRWP
ncbi:MAG TPA: hypothetical protein VFD39_04445 [Trueperaceae bacterium]|nr:hypothetical protein [Trueperaceae bacterium]